MVGRGGIVGGVLGRILMQLHSKDIYLSHIQTTKQLATFIHVSYGAQCV